MALFNTKKTIKKRQKEREKERNIEKNSDFWHVFNLRVGDYLSAQRVAALTGTLGATSPASWTGAENGSDGCHTRYGIIGIIGPSGTRMGPIIRHLTVFYRFSSLFPLFFFCLFFLF